MANRTRKIPKDVARPLFEEKIDTTEEVVDPSDGGTPISATESGDLPVGPSDTSFVTSTPDPTPTPSEVSVEDSPKEYTREMMVEDLRNLFGPIPKRRVPTLVEFPSKVSNSTRFVIIDLNDGLFDDGWKMFQERLGGDEEEYLMCVYDALLLPVPRLYTNVVPYKLKKG